MRLQPVFASLLALLLSLFATASSATGRAASAAGISVGATSYELDLSEGRRIAVFAYRAQNHGPDDPVVIVLPGGGRNGDDYRDSWIDAAERFGLLVLSPSFDEVQFPGVTDYNLAGMVRDTASVESLRDVELTPPGTWLYSAIEHVFADAVARTGSAQTHYDLFGHSAGGQIVHRMVLFASDSRIKRAVAANSGWYTTLAPNVSFPYGLRGLSLPDEQLRKAFGRKLVLFLGELDNAQEMRGHLRHTPETDAQGEHRLARGRHFHAVAQDESVRLGLPLDWRLRVVPGVGHSYREMGAAAADYLYAGE